MNFLIFAFQILPPSDVKLHYVTRNATTGIAVTWVKADNPCGTYSYLTTSFEILGTNLVYEDISSGSFDVAYPDNYNCPVISVVNATTICQAANKTNYSSIPYTSNEILVVLPIDKPEDISYAYGECSDTTFEDDYPKCSVTSEFPFVQDSCLNCSTYPVNVIYEIDLNCTRTNFTSNSTAKEFYCATQSTPSFVKYRLHCSWKQLTGERLNLTTSWSDSYVINYSLINSTVPIPPTPVPVPVLIVIAVVVLLGSVASFAIIMIRIYCPHRAGYFQINQ